MRDETKRARALASKFRSLMAAAQDQDEQIAEMFDAHGVDRHATESESVSARLEQAFEQIASSVAPVPASPSPSPRGLMLRC